MLKLVNCHWRELAQAAFNLLGEPKLNLLPSSYIYEFQHCYILSNLLPSKSLWVKHFHHPALHPIVLSRFMAKHLTGHLTFLILIAIYWMESLFASHCSQHVAINCSLVSYGEISFFLSLSGCSGDDMTVCSKD